MSTIDLGWLPDLLSNLPYEDGNAREQRRKWNFVGVELVDDPTNGWLTLTVNGDPDEPLFASIVTADVFQSPTGEVVILRGAQDSLTSIRFQVDTDVVLSLGNASDVTGMNIPSDRDGLRLGWDGDDATPGYILVEGQDAEASSGQAGGDVTLRTGNGDTGVVGGDFAIDVREDVSNVSAELQVLAGALRLLTLAQRAASTAQIDFGTNSSPINGVLRALALTLTATSSGITKNIASGGDETTQFAKSGNSQGKRKDGYATATTTTATTTDITLYSPQNDVAVGFRAVIIGYETNTKVCSYHVEATFRKAGGTVALVAKTAVHSGEDSAGYDGTLIASTSVIAAQVVTPDAVNVRWEVFWEACIGGET